MILVVKLQHMVVVMIIKPPNKDLMIMETFQYILTIVKLPNMDVVQMRKHIKKMLMEPIVLVNTLHLDVVLIASLQWDMKMINVVMPVNWVVVQIK